MWANRSTLLHMALAASSHAVQSPAAALFATLTRTNTFACVGLDPVMESLPASLHNQSEAKAIGTFSQGVVDAIARAGVGVVKFQSACYERYGSAGFAALEASITHARKANLLVILDAKRGDIGISANHYAAAAAGMGAHFITVSGYLGPSTIEPYLQAGLGVFVLVRTSNPDSDSVQAHTLASGSSVAEMMAAHVRDLATKYEALSHQGIASVGAVVGATKPQDGPRLRAIMPSVPFLVPGYGAQGGTLADIRGMMRPQRTCASDAGVLVTASRSVIYPKGASSNQSWDAAIEGAAKQLVAELSQA